MPSRPNARNWNDVQTAIATVAIVTTLGLWNLFATPAKAKVVQTQEPVVPPTEPPVSAAPTPMPQVKIIFTPGAPQIVSSLQSNPQPQKPKKKNHNNNGGGGGGGSGGTVTQTKSS